VVLLKRFITGSRGKRDCAVAGNPRSAAAILARHGREAVAMARRRRGIGDRKSYAELRGKNTSIPDALLKKLLQQKYAIVGSHSAAKLCKWAGDSVCGRGECYKAKFYGIASHRCLQCTSNLLSCNHACVFCWRVMPERDRYRKIKGLTWDEPGKIAGGLVAAQKKLVSGYGGNERADRKKFGEALSPKHAAISLTGEPCMYPKLGGLIAEFHKRGMTTFLVTNGTFPEALEKLAPLPTQLYVSMVAPNEDIYWKAMRPERKELWKNYLKTLALLPKIGEKTRTVLRMTLCRGVNDGDLEGYAKQIMLASPHYVEVKSMAFVGGARQPGRGLSLGSVLGTGEVGQIAGILAGKTGYKAVDEHSPSRVVLLCRDEKTEKDRKISWH
jgi:tRNA wybutosine-synthesizing protein 1